MHTVIFCVFPLEKRPIFFLEIPNLSCFADFAGHSAHHSPWSRLSHPCPKSHVEPSLAI